MNNLIENMFSLTRGSVSKSEMITPEKQNAHKNGIFLFKIPTFFPWYLMGIIDKVLFDVGKFLILNNFRSKL